jgi:hypothetical protein
MVAFVVSGVDVRIVPSESEFHLVQVRRTHICFPAKFILLPSVLLTQAVP